MSTEESPPIKDICPKCTFLRNGDIQFNNISLPPSSSQLLEQAGVSCTCIYSSLDQTARKINVAKFVNKKVTTLLVTDVAVSYCDVIIMSSSHVTVPVGSWH